MKAVFWIVAALALASFCYKQFSQSQGPNKILLVTGMSPQIEVIREIASERDWRIVCESTAGEMTALGVEPGFFADKKSESEVKEQLFDVASSISQTTIADCSTDAPTISTDHPTANPPLAFGDNQTLQPYLKLARSCGFVEAAIAPIAEIDRANWHTDMPSNLEALYGGPGSANRYGPDVCFVKMMQRLSPTGHSGLRQR